MVTAFGQALETAHGPGHFRESQQQQAVAQGNRHRIRQLAAKGEHGPGQGVQQQAHGPDAQVAPALGREVLAGLGQEKHRQRAEQHAHLHHRKYVQRHAVPVRGHPATGPRLARRRRERM